jgi:phosphoribosylanthranilate isomerase
MTAAVKICGLKTREAVAAAKDADYIGFVFYTLSPRNISPKEAEALRAHASAEIVAVTVDPTDEFLKDMLSAFKPDYLQLHGSETPERVKEIKKTFYLPVIKALPVRNAADIDVAKDYEAIADILMFDAKTEKGPHGGSGVAFDWNLLSGRTFRRPYFLSGGLNSRNVEEALRTSGALMVDVSSGIETSPGVKDAALIEAFIKKVKNL